MLNTDYTNNTNVFEWLFRKIRAIRDIRVPSKFSEWYMLNTDYTNGTNVDEWRLRKIRAIRAIRVPSNFSRGICWTRITRITQMWMNGVCEKFGRFVIFVFHQKLSCPQKQDAQTCMPQYSCHQMTWHDKWQDWHLVLWHHALHEVHVHNRSHWQVLLLLWNRVWWYAVLR